MTLDHRGKSATCFDDLIEHAPSIVDKPVLAGSRDAARLHQSVRLDGQTYTVETYQDYLKRADDLTPAQYKALLQGSWTTPYKTIGLPVGNLPVATAPTPPPWEKTSWAKPSWAKPSWGKIHYTGSSGPPGTWHPIPFSWPPSFPGIGEEDSKALPVDGASTTMPDLPAPSDLNPIPVEPAPETEPPPRPKNRIELLELDD